MNTTISIVIVTYNSSNVLENLFKSIISSRLLVREIIVIENNSIDKDDTHLICNKYSSILNIKFILSKNNDGFAVSCNLGARKSQSKYVLFLNPDTTLANNALHNLISHVESNSADIIGGKILNIHGQNQESAVRRPGLLVGLLEFSNIGKVFNIKYGHNRFYYIDKNLTTSKNDVEVDAVSGAFLLVNKKSFLKLGGFDENMFMYLEDVDLGKRANDANMKVIYCPHSKISHIGGASSKNKNKIRHQAWFDSRKYYFKKHSGFFTNLVLQPLFTIEEYLIKKLKHI